MSKKLTEDILREWLSFAEGTFSVKDIWSDIGIQDYDNKEYLRLILKRWRDEGIIVRTARHDIYRKVDNTAKPIDWQSADPKKDVPIELPFGIHQYCKIYPKSIIIVAGEKQEGKTAFLYKTIQLNMGKFIIDLFNSETGPEQMKERFAPLGIPSPAPFNVYERYDNFADVIHSDHLSIIDYLDTQSEVYLVGAEIDAIFRKLNNVAIIALQKPPPTVTYVRGVRKEYSRDLAYGGAFTAKRAILYITMGSHRAKLLYVKTPRDPKINPNNMTWRYDFSEDGYFTNIERYFGEGMEF